MFMREVYNGNRFTQRTSKIIILSGIVIVESNFCISFRSKCDQSGVTSD
jgi:hypothetical protein